MAKGKAYTNLSTGLKVPSKPSALNVPVKNNKQGTVNIANAHKALAVKPAKTHNM